MVGRLVFDIETDGLLQKCTKLWVVCAYDLDSKKTYEWLPGDLGWKETFNSARALIGHNILGFDLYALKKLFGWEPLPNVSIQDTLIMSRVLNYRRFGNRGHSLAVWGEALGVPKGDFNDWSEFSEEMLVYCRQDVRVNVAIYEQVLQEFMALRAKTEKIVTYMQAEHASTRWCSEAALNGWPFDVEAAKALYVKLTQALDEAHTVLNARLGMKAVAVDKVKGIVEEKEPKWTQKGFYNSHTSKWFDVDPCSGYPGEERMIEGPFSRVEFKSLSIDSSDDVKLFLARNGWVPSAYNRVKDPNARGGWRTTSPKITEEDLEQLGGDGKLYADFLTAKSRYGILKTWLDEVDENGNLHGDCNVIGTPSMRATHSIIVNVPGAEAPWGKEMRSLFTCKPGWKLVGCDSAGNQARGLAHYLNDDSFTDTLLNGDIHTYNAEAATRVLKDMGIDFEVKRSQAKRILYAFLFGASGGKLWSYIFDQVDAEKGARFKQGFLKAVPGFKNLIDKLESIYRKTSRAGDGYIPSIAGNRVYVDSTHKLLVYLLQSAEKATCAAALMLCAKRLKEEGIPYIPCIFYHDEIDFQVPGEHAERAAEIGKQAFVDGPKLFGIEIMDGDAKIGNNWYEIH